MIRRRFLAWLGIAPVTLPAALRHAAALKTVGATFWESGWAFGGVQKAALGLRLEDGTWRWLERRWLATDPQSLYNYRIAMRDVASAAAKARDYSALAMPKPNWIPGIHTGISLSRAELGE